MNHVKTIERPDISLAVFGEPVYYIYAFTGTCHFRQHTADLLNHFNLFRKDFYRSGRRRRFDPFEIKPSAGLSPVDCHINILRYNDVDSNGYFGADFTTDNYRNITIHVVFLL